MKANRILSFVLALVMTVSTLIAGTAVSAEESLYKDVKTSRWSYEDIKYVTEEGLMTGTGDGKFSPAETMTRAMVVTVLYRLQKTPAVNYSAIFSDVKKGTWYTDAVIWAANNGIVNGVGGGKFAPMKAVTREELATIIMRYAPLEFIDTEVAEQRADLTVYSDYGKVHSYAKDALSWANAVGLITGVTATTLEPRGNATREQVAAILRRFKEFGGYKYLLAFNTPVYEINLPHDYPLVDDADIYVSVDGDDANPGTLKEPIASFARAKEMVREKKDDATDEIKVAFMAGEYGSLDNITFTAEDSGTEAVPITYCAYGDGDVVFSNGIRFSEDDFEPLDDSEKTLFHAEAVEKIYKLDLNGKLDKITSRNVLFGNGEVCIEARYPNRDIDGTDIYFRDFTTRVEEEGKEEYEYDKLLCQGPLIKVLNGFSTYDGMKITGMFRTGWLHDTFAVKSYDKTTNILTLDYENSSFDNGYPITSFPLAYEDRMDDTIFFHNLAELLDMEGEYWFDTDTKTLYVYNPQGEYALSTSGTFVTVEKGANHISFVGLEFNGSTENALEINGDNITLDGCTIAHIAGLRAVYARGVRNFTVQNCELYNFVCGGVIVNANANLKLLESANTVITNNYFHDFGLPQYFSDSSAVCINREVGGVVSHNVFKNGAHAGVDYDACIETYIEYNIFDHMMRTTIDYGAVYSWSNTGERGNIIRYNLFMNGREYCVYIDGSYGQIVYGNIFYNGGAVSVVMNGGRDNEVHDNISIKTNFLMYNPGAYSEIINGTTDQMGPNSWPFTFLYRNAPKVGEEGYDKWLNKWPIMYSYNTDPDKVGEVECIYTTVNYIKNNALFGVGTEWGEICEMFGVLENNQTFTFDENPFFADPTHGDYTIVSGGGVIDDEYILDYSKLGIQR